jgi:hypothetical protein
VYANIETEWSGHVACPSGDGLNVAGGRTRDVPFSQHLGWPDRPARPEWVDLAIPLAAAPGV